MHSVLPLNYYVDQLMPFLCILGSLYQCFWTAGPWPSTGPWHQLYRATRFSLGIDN